jgi:hypothetical protein
VEGPDLFAEHEHRPYVQLSDDTHPFSDEEALFTAVTSTQRDAAIPLTDSDFTSGGLPRESFVNPWTVVSIRLADVEGEEGRLGDDITETITREAATYLGVGQTSSAATTRHQVSPS